MELFKEVGLFDASLPSTQDYALWFDFFRVCPLHFQDRQLVQSRVHPDQGTHKIVQHIEECNELWSGFLRRLSDSEMSVMEGSPYRFLIKTAEFLETTPYTVAAKLSRDMAAEALGRIKVSVVIPFFNRTGWAIQAIRSVLEQSHKNFEILLIDDGSSEDLSVLQEFIARDSRIKYYRQDNAGPGSARNHGVALASGRYIAFLDSDDTFHPEKLETQIRYMEDGGFVLSHTSYLRMNIEGNITGEVSSGKVRGDLFPGIVLTCPIAMPTVMALSSILKGNRFSEHMHIGEDVCLWITLSSKSEWGAIDVPLSSVRVGPVSAAFDRKKQVLGLIGIAYFLVRDPVFCSYGHQIRELLSDASALIADTKHSSQNSKNFVATLTNVSLRSKLLRSLRNDGMYATWHRVRRHLGKK